MNQTLGPTIFELGEACGEARGEARGWRRVVLQLGRRRWGEPPPEVEERITQISDIARLEELVLRVLDAASWYELLQG